MNKSSDEVMAKAIGTEVKQSRKRLTPDERIQQLQAKIELIKSRKAKRSSKDETRRKILVGAAVLNEIEKNVNLKAEVKILLTSFLTRKSDKDIFSDIL